MYSTMDVRRELFERKEHIHGVMEQVSTRISALLEEGKAAGEFDPALPTAVMVSTFFSLLSPQAYKRLIQEEGMSLDELMLHLRRVYFRGITTTSDEGN